MTTLILKLTCVALMVAVVALPVAFLSGSVVVGVVGGLVTTVATLSR